MVPTARIQWPQAARIVASRRGPIAAFRSLVDDPADYATLLAIEAETSPMAATALGHFASLAPEDRVTGDGAELIMTPFVLPTPSRFSDGSYGVFYAGDDVGTASAERAFHIARALAASHQPQTVVRLEAYLFYAGVHAELHDLRHAAVPPPPEAIYDPSDWSQGQVYANPLHVAGSTGLVYDSVRRAGAQCVAIFRPRCVSRPIFAQVVYFDWDGATITTPG